MNGNGTNKRIRRNVDTRLHMDDLIGRAEKPAQNLVPRKNQSLGFIRFKKVRGRIKYLWCRTEYRAGLPPRQVVVKYLGEVLPKGVKLGTVDEKTAKKLMEGK